MSSNTIVMALQKHHLHVTRPRQIVYGALSHNEPLSMRELVAICVPEIDKSSLYRTIALFEQLGIAQRLQIGWKYKIELSNEYQEHHHHLTCLQCGLMTPLPEDTLIEDRLNALATNLGFTPKDHQLEVRGICKSCAST